MSESVKTEHHQPAPPDVAETEPRLNTREVGPYLVEVDSGGCQHCGADKTWTVVGPDGVAHSESWMNPEDAESFACALNEAFSLGVGSVGNAPPSLSEGRWQSISTAPKDGTRVLLLKPNGHAEIGRYHAWDNPNRKQGHGAMWRYQRSMSPAYDHQNQPTHWMPILPLPQVGSATEPQQEHADSARRSAAQTSD